MVMRPRAPRAITLFEVLLALALMGMLIGAMLWFSADIANGRRRAIEAAKRSLAITALFDRLEADLAFAVRQDPALGAGVVGDATSISLLSRSVLPGTRSGPIAALGDLQRQQIRFDPAARRIIGLRAAAGAAGAAPSMVDAEIYALRFRYHDGHGWLEAFDSNTAGMLPVAVEVAAWLSPLPEWADLAAGAGAAEMVESSRLTFDTAEIIDAEAAAGATERLGRELPPPDRVRVIVVPDAGTARSRGRLDDPAEERSSIDGRAELMGEEE